MITAHGTVDNAVEALKTGAFDYITKPFDQGEVRVIVKKALRTRDLASADATREPVAAPRRRRAPRASASSARARRSSSVYAILERVADTPTTVLVTGESGTGKELVARALHENSSRRDRPFIKVNCAAIPKDLIESELFGYERGAFTGAVGVEAGPLRARLGRHALPRRDRRDPDRDAGEAPARPAGERVRARRRHQDDPRRRAPRRRHQPRSEAGDRRRRRSARISSTASTSCRSRCRRCASGASDIPLLVRYFIAKFNARLKKSVEGRRARRARAALVATRGPATSASSRT